ncbi:unnamed protein product [Microthlaspi erraticum]|uniref:CCHC-type domain-containing protein n=1 Tax=Microthlaspi erraticum TaxID=1685480 RepID=A0A6D2KAR2_9BRAS|nr:unnamed protein product [Microthlaspi erraticum]
MGSTGNNLPINNGVTETISTTAGSLLHVNMTNVTKLTATNYIMWSLANPAHALYKRQDKLLYSAILGVISPSIQSLMSKATTTIDIWETLASTYAKPSRGHIKQLKHQLKQWKKGTKTVDEYIQGLVTRFDQLALLGKVIGPIDLEDQIEFVLEGLPEDYKSVIDQVEGRDAPPSLTELHEKLINHEAKILTAEPPSHLPVSANIATNRFKPNNKNNNRNQQWQNQSQPRQASDNNNTPWQPRPYLGKCQICGIQGHSARRCPQLARNATGLLPSPTNWQPRANYAAGSSQITPGWVVDSGATHHITSDLANLAPLSTLHRWRRSHHRRWEWFVNH